MKPYAELEAADLEAKKAEVEKQKQEETAATAKATEEAKGYETGITYDNLARTPDDYEGQKLKFTGKVIQVIEGDYETQIRFSIDSDYDKMIYCSFSPTIIQSRLLEDDIITIFGKSIGLISYDSTMGGKITIPSVYVDKIEQ